MADPFNKADSLRETQHGGKHYKNLAIEPAQYCHANDVGFLEGNVIKYITRHSIRGDKEKGLVDARKALHYCQMVLEMEYGVSTTVAYSDDQKSIPPPSIPPNTVFVNYTPEQLAEIEKALAGRACEVEAIDITSNGMCGEYLGDRIVKVSGSSRPPKGYPYEINGMPNRHLSKSVSGEELGQMLGRSIWYLNAVTGKWSPVLASHFFNLSNGIIRFTTISPSNDMLDPHPDPGHWEVVPVKDGEPRESTSLPIVGYCVRWSIPDAQERYMWVGHYYAGEDGQPSLSWCEHAAGRHAKRLNDIGKLPNDPEFHPHPIKPVYTSASGRSGADIAEVMAADRQADVEAGDASN